MKNSKEFEPLYQPSENYSELQGKIETLRKDLEKIEAELKEAATSLESEQKMLKFTEEKGNEFSPEDIEDIKNYVQFYQGEIEGLKMFKNTTIAELKNRDTELVDILKKYAFEAKA